MREAFSPEVAGTIWIDLWGEIKYFLTAFMIFLKKNSQLIDMPPPFTKMFATIIPATMPKPRFKTMILSNRLLHHIHVRRVPSDERSYRKRKEWRFFFSNFFLHSYCVSQNRVKNLRSHFSYSPNLQ